MEEKKFSSGSLLFFLIEVEPFQKVSLLYILLKNGHKKRLTEANLYAAACF